MNLTVMSISLDLGKRAAPDDVAAAARAVQIAAAVGLNAVRLDVGRVARRRMARPTVAEFEEAAGNVFEYLQDERNTPLANKLVERDNRWLDDVVRVDSDSVGYRRPYPGRTLEEYDLSLYQLLVRAEQRANEPDPPFVRFASYVNPFTEELVLAKGAAEVGGKIAELVRTIATLGSERRIKRASARVAEATADDEIMRSRTDRALKDEQLRQERLRTELLEQEVLQQRLQTAELLRSLDARGQQDELVELIQTSGLEDEAKLVAEAEPMDAAALTEFVAREVTLTQKIVPGPAELD